MNAHFLTVTRHMLRLFLMIIFATMAFPVQQAMANRYDDEEVVRRYLERGDQKEQAEREAAKQRYDQKHPSEISSSGGEGAVFTILIVVAVFMLVIGRSCGWGGFSGGSSSPSRKDTRAINKQQNRISKKSVQEVAAMLVKASHEEFTNKPSQPQADGVLYPGENKLKPAESTPLDRESELKRMRAWQKQKEHKERQRLEKKRRDAEKAQHEARCRELAAKQAAEIVEKKAKDDAELAEWKRHQQKQR